MAYPQHVGSPSPTREQPPNINSASVHTGLVAKLAPLFVERRADRLNAIPNSGSHPSLKRYRDTEIADGASHCSIRRAPPPPLQSLHSRLPDRCLRNGTHWAAVNRALVMPATPPTTRSSNRPTTRNNGEALTARPTIPPNQWTQLLERPRECASAGIPSPAANFHAPHPTCHPLKWASPPPNHPRLASLSI